jgi:flagellar basal body-associated protein FliL
VVETGTVKQSNEGKGKNVTPLMIGIISAVGAIVIAGIAVTIFCLTKKKKKEDSDGQVQETETEIHPSLEQAMTVDNPLCEADFPQSFFRDDDDDMFGY